MTHVLAFLLGMATLPTVLALHELAVLLLDFWRRLDEAEDRNVRHQLPPLGRFTLRVMRFFKGRRSA